MSVECKNQSCIEDIDLLNKKIKELYIYLEERTSNPENFVTVDELENKWKELNNATKHIFGSIISKYLSNDVNEKNIIN